MRDQKINDLEIQSLVDGELSGHDRNVLIERIHRSPDALKRLEDLMYQKFLLREWAKRLS